MRFLLEKTKKTNKQKNHVVERQITANHKKQTYKVNDFSAFLYMERCKNLGSLKFFLRYAS